MRLVLVRHGESVGNAERRLQGRADYPLSERGVEQSRRLARRLSSAPLRAIYSSPLARARQTADALSEATGLEVVDLPDVQEYDFGELSGVTLDEYRLLVNPAQRYIQGEFPPIAGEEGRDHFRERVCEALWGLADGHRGETVAVVCHGGPIVAFVLEVLGLPYRRPIPLTVQNCSVTIIDVRDDNAGPMDPRPRAVLAAFNDTCHLDGAE